jgi:uncharacterized repeat protein (TIGR03803 family)
MAGTPYLVDSNVLLRWVKPDDRDYPLVVSATDATLQRGAVFCYTSQNVAEFWNTCTRPLDRNGYGLSPRGSRNLLMLLLAAAMLVTLPDGLVHAQTFTTLYTFTGGADGGLPSGGLILDGQGNLYGSTRELQFSFGTVFEFSPASGILNTLYTFQGKGDGSDPNANLSFNGAGNLYGTTFGSDSGYYGTVFELSPNGSGGWQKTTLLQFDGLDGLHPTSGLVIDGTGNVYGTTLYGGPGNWGIVFELSPGASGWTETILHHFGGVFRLQGGLVFDPQGNLYGTANGGGPSGCGGVFELTPASGNWNVGVLHAFRCGSDGANPEGKLALDNMGRIFGTTNQGGAFKQGEVYMLTPHAGKGWQNRVIHSFNGADGAFPTAGVTLDAAGNIYGATLNGGVKSVGVVYKLTATSSTSWTHSILHTFTGPDGADPSALLLDSAGDLFGTTVEGGAGNLGTVFEITP